MSIQPKHLKLSYQEYNQDQKIPYGFKMGEYTVMKQLGKGGFGTVYKAKNQKGDLFALKLLNKRQASQEKTRDIRDIKQRLIESQHKIMEKCNSQHLIKLFDVFENEDLKVLIIQLCDGMTLADELLQRKTKLKCKAFSEEEAVNIIKQIINGIAELHRNKIVHRDLKTQNVMKHKTIYKIIDFGFSKLLTLSHQNQKTRNTVLGTPTTMAPEVMYGHKYGLKADIWSIGVIFFELVFGKVPYDSRSADRFYAQIEERFNANSYMQYEGITLSKDAYDFLKQTLKVNQDQRIGWRQMIEHPLINLRMEGQGIERPREQGEPLCVEVEEIKQVPSLRQIQDRLQKTLKKNELQVVEIKPKQIPKQHYQHQKKPQKVFQTKQSLQNHKDELNCSKKKSRFDLDILIQQQKEKQYNKPIRQVKEIYKPNIQLNSSQCLLNSSEITIPQKEQQHTSAQYQKYLLNFQQIEYIFKNIFQCLQRQKLVDLSPRQYIQLMHLLISRCFRSLSFLKQQLTRNPQKQQHTLKQLNAQIQTLYKQVNEKFNEYDTKLRDIQNKPLQIVKDLFRKVVKRGAEKQKNRIIGGEELRQDKTENQSVLWDFKKTEQVSYTVKYLQKLLPKLTASGAKNYKVLNSLKHYSQIMNASVQSLAGQRFSSFVKKLLE